MKPSNIFLALIATMMLSLFSLSSSAVTMTNETQAGNSSFDSQSTKRGALVKRYAEGKIETDMGTYYTSGAEVVDHRPIDAWYQPAKNAEVSLYFKGSRLIRVVIY